MQAGGQYGLPDHYVVARQQQPHMFSLSHDMPLSPTAHGPNHHHLQHLEHHSQQHHQQHHHPQHSQHAQHPQHQHSHQHALQQVEHQHQQQQAMVEQLGLAPDSPEVPSPITSRPSPTSFKRESLGDDDGGEEEGRGTGGNRWPRPETLALIKIRSEMDGNFRDSGLKGPLWEDVSRKLAELGYQRSSKKCKEKFENIHKYYKKTKDGKAGRQDGKNYRFFSELEALYGGGNSSQHGEGGTLMLTGSSGAAIGGGAERSFSSQLLAENSSGLQLSSDSEDDYDDPGDNDEQEKPKKRKRKEEGKIGHSKMLYFENLVKKLMEKQEAMQQKFLETIERREHERVMREESWKREQEARLAQEQETRAEEQARAATRDAALVALLQKLTGQTLQLPQIVPPQPLTLVVPEPHHVEDHQEKESFDPNSRRWPKSEVHALIRLRSQMEPRFQEPGPKGPLWEEISNRMASLGYSRNTKRCKEKWENINKYFRKTKETNKKRSDNAKTCPYFNQLDALYQNGVLGTPNSKLNKLDDNSDELTEHPSNREDSEHGQGADAEDILALMPSEEGPAGASTSINGGGGHFFPSSDNGSSGDQKVMKQTQMLENPSTGDYHHSAPAVLALNFDGLHRGDGKTFTGNSSSVREFDGVTKRLPDQREQFLPVEDFNQRSENESEVIEHGSWQQQEQHQDDYMSFLRRGHMFPQEILLS